MNKRTNICLNHEVYLKLRNRGKFGESFSELVSRIIDETYTAEKDLSEDGNHDR